MTSRITGGEAVEEPGKPSQQEQSNLIPKDEEPLPPYTDSNYIRMGREEYGLSPDESQILRLYL